MKKIKARCEWAGTDQLYVDYHDNEWGMPVHDDRKLFEFLLLESAQAGLSWIIILRKRENYRKAFDGFDPEKIALYDAEKVEELLRNPGIIRNRKKIESAINNARCFLEVRKEFGSFDKYIWSFTGGRPLVNAWQEMAELPATSPESDKLCKDLKKRGFKFLGSTTCYSHMQATGMVNDHITCCFRYKQVQG
ncbi:MAG: DNA-3-methyladenine glycosylase I [Victivallaceae bacterium]